MLQAIYAGEVLVFRQLKVNSRSSSSIACKFYLMCWLLQAMTGLADLFQRDMLPGHELFIADAESPAGRIELCDSFESSEDVQRLFRAALSEAGVALEETCWDRVRLRVQPSGGGFDEVSAERTATGKYSCTLPLHRDTWGSNISAQVGPTATLLLSSASFAL